MQYITTLLFPRGLRSPFLVATLQPSLPLVDRTPFVVGKQHLRPLSCGHWGPAHHESAGPRITHSVKFGAENRRILTSHSTAVSGSSQCQPNVHRLGRGIKVLLEFEVRFIRYYWRVWTFLTSLSSVLGSHSALRYHGLAVCLPTWFPG